MVGTRQSTADTQGVSITTAGPLEWVVLADWLGCTRVVYRGTLFGCLSFVLEVSS